MSALPASMTWPDGKAVFCRGAQKIPKNSLTGKHSHVKLLVAGTRIGRRSDLNAGPAGTAGVIFDIKNRHAARGFRREGHCVTATDCVGLPNAGRDAARRCPGFAAMTGCRP